MSDQTGSYTNTNCGYVANKQDFQGSKTDGDSVKSNGLTLIPSSRGSIPPTWDEQYLANFPQQRAQALQSHAVSLGGGGSHRGASETRCNSCVARNRGPAECVAANDCHDPRTGVTVPARKTNGVITCAPCMSTRFDRAQPPLYQTCTGTGPQVSVPQSAYQGYGPPSAP